MAATFEARYRGSCASCSEAIIPGQQVRYEEKTLVHADCEDPEVSPRHDDVSEVCPVCFMTKAISGACGCIA